MLKAGRLSETGLPSGLCPSPSHPTRATGCLRPCARTAFSNLPKFASILSFTVQPMSILGCGMQCGAMVSRLIGTDFLCCEKRNTGAGYREDSRTGSILQILHGHHAKMRCTFAAKNCRYGDAWSRGAAGIFTVSTHQRARWLFIWTALSESILRTNGQNESILMSESPERLVKG